MDARKIVLKQTAAMALGELICSGAMLAVFTALGSFTPGVLWGAVTGALVVIANHFFMALTVSVAAERAEKGDVEQGKKMVQLSSAVRLLCMGAAMLLGIKLGANVIALVLPLAFSRPILMVLSFFWKEG